VALAKAVGLRPATHKYEPENLDWFVLYQFRAQSPTEIARNSPREMEASTVFHGIQAAARLIVWERLRSSD